MGEFDDLMTEIKEDREERILTMSSLKAQIEEVRAKNLAFEKQTNVLQLIILLYELLQHISFRSEADALVYTFFDSRDHFDLFAKKLSAIRLRHAHRVPERFASAVKAQAIIEYSKDESVHEDVLTDGIRLLKLACHVYQTDDLSTIIPKAFGHENSSVSFELPTVINTGVLAQSLVTAESLRIGL